MRPKLSKEEQAARAALIDKGIEKVGIKKFEYMGEPPEHRVWKKNTEKKRWGNKAKDKTDRGIGADTARDHFQLKEAKK